MDNPRDVILVSGAGPTGPLILPLSETHDVAVLVDAAGRQAVEVGAQGVISVNGMVDADMVETVKAAVANLTAKAVNAVPEVDLRFRDIQPVDAPDTLGDRLPEWWGGYCLHTFGELVPPLAALEKLAKDRRVVGCVTHEDVSPLFRAAVLWAKAKGLPTIHVPHAPTHLLDDAGPDIHRETRTDWIAASGLQMAQWYERQGFPTERIRTVGAVQWDGLYSGALPTRDEAKRGLAIGPEQRTLTYATTWGQTTSLRGGFEREFDDGLAAVLRLARAWEAVTIIKVHPHEDNSHDTYYGQALEAAGQPGMVMRDHLIYALRASDLLIAQGPSNLCIEAAILGVPSCYLQTQGFDYSTALPYRGTVDELPQMADAALGSNLYAEEFGPWDRFAHEYNCVHPFGGAIENAAAFIREICNG